MRTTSILLCALLGCGSEGGGAGPDAPSADDAGVDGAFDYGGEVLAFASALGIALDDDRVYWASWLGGSVDAVAKTGGDPVEVVPDLVGPAALVLVGDLLFVTAENEANPDDGLWRGTTMGGAGAIVDGSMQREHLAADGDTIYYLDANFALSRVTGEAAPQPLAVQVGFDFFDVVGGVVLYDNAGTLEAYDTTGATTTPLATFTDDLLGATVHGGEVLALTISETSTLTLWSVPPGGGAPAELWSAPGYAYAGVQLVIDGDHVYLPVLDWPLSGYGSIVRISISGGDHVVIAADQPAPAAIALDASHVYWTARGVGGDASNLNRRGRVMRRPR